MTQLYEIVKGSYGQSINNYNLYHKGRPVERTGGKTLRDHGIKAGSTLTMAKKGLLLNVTNPLVSHNIHLELCRGERGQGYHPNSRVIIMLKVHVL